MARCLDCSLVPEWEEELTALKARRKGLLLGTITSSDRDVSVKGPAGGEIKIGQGQSGSAGSIFEWIDKRIKELERDLAFCKCGSDDLQGMAPSDSCMDDEDL